MEWQQLALQIEKFLLEESIDNIFILLEKLLSLSNANYL